MTVEPQNAHDPEDDDFYVLGEEDPEPAAMPSKGPGDKRQHGPGTVGAEEDVLFVPTEEQRVVAGESPFLATQGSKWDEELAAADASHQAAEAGTGFPPAETEASDEDLDRFAETGDFAIIDASAQLADLDRDAAGEQPIAAEAAEATAEESAAAGEQTVVQEEDDDWAPVEVSEDPLLEGPAIGTPTQAEESQATSDETEASEAEVDGAVAVAAAAAVHGPTLVAGPGAGPSRRRFGRMLAAAAILFCLGGGYFAWQEGWIGTRDEQPTLVERAEIPRPRVSVTPAPPDVAKTGDPKPDPVSDPSPMPDPKPEPTPDPKPDLKTDPKPEPDPVPDPKVAKEPVQPPVETTPKGTEPATPGGAQTGPQLPDLTQELGVLRVGDGLTIKENPTSEQPKQRVSMNGIVPGSQAFAQLRNGNFFVGNVKAVDTDVLTLKLEKGEVTLGIVDLKTIVSLASSEYKELKKVEQGFVRLNNRNRLLGTILASQDENIILENKANRVVIPKSEIEELGTVGRTTVRFAEEDTSWVDRMIERQLSDKEVKEKDLKISPAPLVEQGAKPADKAKIKSKVEDDAGARPK